MGLNVKFPFEQVGSLLGRQIGNEPGYARVVALFHIGHVAAEERGLDFCFHEPLRCSYEAERWVEALVMGLEPSSCLHMVVWAKVH